MHCLVGNYPRMVWLRGDHFSPSRTVRAPQTSAFWLEGPESLRSEGNLSRSVFAEGDETLSMHCDNHEFCRKTNDHGSKSGKFERQIMYLENGFSIFALLEGYESEASMRAGNVHIC